MDMATFNACILFKTGGKRSRLDFLYKLVDRILEQYFAEKVPKRKGRPSLGDTPLCLNTRHFPSYIPLIPKKENPMRRCHVCVSTNRRKDKSFMYSECDKSLCVMSCFETYMS